MTDDRLRRWLEAAEEPLAPDPAFAVALRDELRHELGFVAATTRPLSSRVGPAIRPGRGTGRLLLVAALVVAGSVGVAALAGSFVDMGRTPIFLGFSPDSSTLVLVNQEAKVRLVDRAGRDIRMLDETLTGGRFIAFSADGRLMAGAEVAGKVRIWDTKSWKVLRDLDAYNVRHLAFSPDGRVLATGSTIGEVRLWGGGGRLTPAPGADSGRSGAPGFLGISGDTAEGDDPGVTISTVIEGTAAEKGGLKVGDRIIRIGTSATDSFESLRAVVTSLKAGDEVEIVYRRDGAEKKVKVKLGSRPSDE